MNISLTKAIVKNDSTLLLIEFLLYMLKSLRTKTTLFKKTHILGIEDLTSQDINLILEQAEKFVSPNRKKEKVPVTLVGRTQINIFFEHSTRTQASFEIAGKRLGADVMNIDLNSSSISKGETLLDTAINLNAMRPDIIVVRHPNSGAVQLLSEKVKCSVINAGDGRHEHPTQALLDALTIRRRKSRLDGLIISICGDIAHSRVARSNIFLLTKMQNRVRLVGPSLLIPKDFKDLGIEIFSDMQKGIANADVIMMLRLQKERMDRGFIPSEREYFHRFGLDQKKLAFAKPDAIVMHPGPMNRGVEIDGMLADDITRSAIQEQVEMGVAIRMAILELLIKRN